MIRNQRDMVPFQRVSFFKSFFVVYRVAYYIWILCLIPCFLFGKVYDCFPFFNELELLQVRFAELNDTVDYFVLVESVETQRGDPKPLYFAENKHLFEKYLPKVIHVIIDERHPEMGMWKREHFQRNAILRGLTKCSPSDLIILSDLDEIPRASVIANLKKLFEISSPKPAKAPLFRSKKAEKKYRKKYTDLGAYAFQMDHYSYQLNRQIPSKEIRDGGYWQGTIVMTYEKMKAHSPQYFRQRRNKLPRIENGGWHFSSMGGKEKVRQKISSIVEGRSDGASVPDEEIERWINEYPIVALGDIVKSCVSATEHTL